MKFFLTAVLIVSVVAVAVSSQYLRPLPPRSRIFPRDPAEQGPGYYEPRRLPRTVNLQGVCGRAKVGSRNINTTGMDRIVGGTQAVPHEFPWQVALTIDGGSFCGGTLISADYVLTAAHCADGAKAFKMMFGSHDRTQVGTRLIAIGGVPITSSSRAYTLHPDWDPSTLANDIAIIRLPSPIRFKSHISPVCAPITKSRNAGDLLLASGWGTSASNMTKVEGFGIPNDKCADVHGDIDDNIMCVKMIGKKDCDSYSGGPLILEKDGVSFLAGVATAGVGSQCTDGSPVQYTRVSSYIDWIKDNTGLV